MRVLVPVKRVVDPNVRVRLNAAKSDIDLAGARMAINPFDEIAVEEALKLKEAGKVSEIIVVSLGPAAAAETLRHALAMGADRAIHVVSDAGLQPLAVANVLRALVESEQAGLVLMGKQAIDDDMNATGQMLAARLGWPQGTFASSVTVKDGAVDVVREVDGGLETVELTLPAVITTDLRLNQPRYASLPNIMKAKSKPLQTRPVADLGVDVAPRHERLAVSEPPARTAGTRVGSVDELAEKILQIAKVK